MRKSIELEGKANRYLKRAENISSRISSDDPDAIGKLKEKLAGLESVQQRMKEVNAAARKKRIAKPFLGYQMANNNANMASIRKRNVRLSAMREMEVNEDVVGDWGRLHESKEKNRIQLLFISIPSAEVRSELKRSGFRWSPTDRAWQRTLDSRGRILSRQIITKL